MGALLAALSEGGVPQWFGKDEPPRERRPPNASGVGRILLVLVALAGIAGASYLALAPGSASNEPPTASINESADPTLRGIELEPIPPSPLEPESQSEPEPQPKPEPQPEPESQHRPESESEPGVGSLNINSLPRSEVFIDGRAVGKTPILGLKVPAGSRTVVLVRPELGKKTVVVDVQAGKATTTVLRFQ